MSDFDKEAEREKLREKYERDEAEREATQRMSDLLLKGATMTNTHCGTCGDPLFQENGTTFCPSCHGNPDAVQGTELEAEAADEAGDAADERGADAATSADTGSDATARAAGDTDPATAPDSRPDAPDTDQREPTADTAETAADAPADAETETASTSDASTPRSPPQTPDTSSRSHGEAQPQTQTSPAGGRSHRGSSRGQAARSADDLEAARESLVQTLEKFAAEAAATDDPQYATACLEAAHEASETLNSLR